MNKADALGFVLAAVARLITGAQGHWKGVPPKAEQRIYFANHQSHLDWVLIWATLPADLRAQTRPIAASDYWTTTPLKHWLTREVFRAVYVDRERKEGGPDPLEPLVAALEQGDSLVIFPEGTRTAPGTRGAYKPGVAALYRVLGLACTPMATNSGVHWPAHGFLRRPGLVVYEFLEPLPPGLERGEFMDILETRLEAASTALLPL